MILKFPFLFNVILTLLLAATASFGDFCVNYFTVHLHKALCDNATHAAVAVISWLIVYVCHKYKNINQMCVEIIICGMVASAIDLDHFFIARSTSLKAAVNLKNRPPLHCTTIPVLFCLSLYLLGSLLHVHWLHKTALLIFTAFFSHHIRDANRRGFWIHPFGSTPPVPKWMYIVITCLIPHTICLLSAPDRKRTEEAYISYKEYVV